jgi:hypothetical protein
MRSIFPYHYPWSKEQFDALWSDALFVFDASALLNIYGFSKKAREQIVEGIRQLHPNIWMPYQFALEYQRNRLGVIRREARKYEEAKETLSKSKEDSINALGTHSAGRLMRTAVVGPLTSSFDTAIECVGEAHDELEALLKSDPYHDKLTELFEGHVGPCTPTKELHQLFDEAKTRFSHFIPPGFEDLDKLKDKMHPYGDYLGWLQIVERAKEYEKSVILVSDDNKPDWWSKDFGVGQRPRAELRTEFHEVVGHEFYMYKLHQFLTEAANRGKVKLDSTALGEVREAEKAENDGAADAANQEKARKPIVPKAPEDAKKRPDEVEKRVPLEGKKTPATTGGT